MLNLSVRNVLDVYASATSEQRSEGLAWYSAAHTFALGLAERYGLSLVQAAGIIAVLSPQVSWDRNMVAADEICRTGDAVAVLGASKAKALRILAGEDPAEVMGCPACKRGARKHVCSGKKVRSFFACIVDPDNPFSVCVDRHAFDIANGRVGGAALRKVLDRVGMYEQVADTYRHAARAADVSPASMQAITWVAWRAITERERFPQRYGSKVAA